MNGWIGYDEIFSLLIPHFLVSLSLSLCLYLHDPIIYCYVLLAIPPRSVSLDDGDGLDW
jgi:hypothetical protein